MEFNYADLSFASSISTLTTRFIYAYLSAFPTQFALDAGIDWRSSRAFFPQSFCLVWPQSATFNGNDVGKRYTASINSAINTAG